MCGGSRTCRGAPGADSTATANKDLVRSSPRGYAGKDQSPLTFSTERLARDDSEVNQSVPHRLHADVELVG